MVKSKTSKQNGKESVTRKEFNERMDTVDQRFEKIDQRFNKVELALQNQTKVILNNSKDPKVIKETMATKSDINKIINILDDLSKKTEDYGNKAILNTHRSMN